MHNIIRHHAGRALALSAAIVVGAAGMYFLRPSDAAVTGGSGGPKTDQTNLSYTANGVTSKYHVYAAGLDWTKPVGMIIYADGSAEYGLKNPTSSYLLGGSNGLVAVAKRNNMVLVTPLAPGTGCPDGDGTCWYEDSGGVTTQQKVQWAEALVKNIQSQYQIDLDRVAMGGYSSGAELASIYWVPSGAAQRTMTDGVIVCISFGSPDAGSRAIANASADFKSKVHMNWNVGDRDTGSWTPTALQQVKAGHAAYTSAGFSTSLDIIPGLGHNREDFGLVMEAQIKEHVKPATGTVNPNPNPNPEPNPNPNPNPNPTPKRGDLNGDGRVNITDLSILLANWG